MFDFIYHSGITTKQNKISIITEALLLSPSVDKSVNSRYNRTVKEAQSGHITSTHLTGDVFTMCFILTINYTMKTSLQQQESFVICVGLSP